MVEKGREGVEGEPKVNRKLPPTLQEVAVGEGCQKVPKWHENLASARMRHQLNCQTRRQGQTGFKAATTTPLLTTDAAMGAVDKKRTTDWAGEGKQRDYGAALGQPKCLLW
mgnify:CR=1 FL=1